jgi:RNA polymerase sigma-70 factor (ECF subfamily)
MNQTDTIPFTNLIEANKGILYTVCNNYCKDPSKREDLAQEILIQLWKSMGSWDAKFPFSTWMYRVALNVAISYYRKEKNQLTPVSLDEQDIQVAGDNDNWTEKEEKLHQLQLLINQLKSLDKALMLLYLDGKTYQEIGLILGITQTNVATKISRIKEQLKQSFSKIA